MIRAEVERKVEAFAAAMRCELLKRANIERQPQWPEIPIGTLAAQCQWKAGLVERAERSCSPEEIQKQAVDLANYAMMVFDNSERERLRNRGN